MNDDNVIRFRKPPPPKKPRRPLRLSPWTIVILAGLAIGAATFVLDQQTGPKPPRVAQP
jgi:hypothetical protein